VVIFELAGLSDEDEVFDFLKLSRSINGEPQANIQDQRDYDAA